MNGRIVVTGGAGFIGRNIVAALNAAGREDILVVDHLGTSEKWKNLRGLRFADYLEREEFRRRRGYDLLPLAPVLAGRIVDSRPASNRFLHDFRKTLGDLAVSLGVLRREAAQEGRGLAAHFAHLVVHGTLHLLGHDHLQAGEAMLMERTEARILRRMGFPNPWALRSAAERPRNAT